MSAHKTVEAQLTFRVDMIEFGYCAKHVDLELSDEQALVLRRVLNALQSQCAKLKNKRPVLTAPEALRWILESIGRQAAKAQENGSSKKEAGSESKADRREGPPGGR